MTGNEQEATAALLRWRQKMEAFMKAAADESVEELRSAIANFGEGQTEDELLRMRDATGLSLLHIAAAGGNLPLATFLARECPELLSEDKKNETPLHCAARAGRIEVVKFLLDEMKPDAKYQPNIDNLCPVQLSLHAPGDTAGQLFDLFTQGESWKPELGKISSEQGSFLQWAVLTGSATLVAKVCDFVPTEEIEREHSAAGVNGFVPPSSILLTAASNALELLEPICAKVNEEILWRDARDREGSTALHNAVEENNFQLVQRILSTPAGRSLANVARTSDNLSPFQIASSQNLKDLLFFHTRPNLRTPATLPSPKKSKAHAVAADALEEAQSHKQTGNVLQSRGDLIGSEEAYRKGLQCLDWIEGRQYEEAQVRKLVSVLFANLSFVKLRQSDASAALAEAQRAVHYNPDWAKAYYRLAQAYKALDDYEEATQQMYMAMLKDDKDISLKAEFKLVLEEAQRRARAKSSFD